MVRLVAARAGVQEGEHTRYQQGRFVVRYRVRTGKDSACLAVHALAVAEKERFACRVVLVEDTTLPDEALVHQRRVAYLHARGDDEIGAFHAAAQLHGCGSIRIDGAVLQARHAHQLCVVANAHILDTAAVEDTNIVAYRAHRVGLRLCVIVHHLLQCLYHHGAVAIERHHIGEARTQTVKDRNLSAPALVHHGHTHTVAESGLAVHEDGVHILDTGVVANTVVSDVVVDIVEVHIVAYLAVVEHGMLYAGMHTQPAREGKLAVEHAHLHRAGELHIAHESSVKAVFHPHLAPVLCRAALRYQLRLLYVC